MPKPFVTEALKPPMIDQASDSRVPMCMQLARPEMLGSSQVPFERRSVQRSVAKPQPERTKQESLECRRLPRQPLGFGRRCSRRSRRLRSRKKLAWPVAEQGLVRKSRLRLRLRCWLELPKPAMRSFWGWQRVLLRRSAVRTQRCSRFVV